MRSRRDVGNRGKKFVSFKISVRSYRDSERVELHGEISAILARSCQSRRDVENLAANSRFEKPTNIKVRSQ